MANAVQEAMDEWGIKFLRDRGNEVADDAVIDFEDDYYDIGYCETCSYIVYRVYVSTNDTPDGAFVRETYDGSMGELIREMNGR